MFAWSLYQCFDQNSESLRSKVKRYIKLVLYRMGVVAFRWRNIQYGLIPFVDIQRLSRNVPLKIIFDVGANRGDWTKEARYYFQSAEFHCFEPTPDTFSMLKTNLKKFEGIHFHNIGLGEKKEQKEFYLFSTDGLNSFILGDRGNSESKFEQMITVNVFDLDNFCTDNKIREIDLLKVDVEGAELDVLMGAKNLISSLAIRFIFVECEFHKTVDPHGNFFELHAFLSKHGYRFVTIYTEAANSEFGFIWGSALFSR